MHSCSLFFFLVVSYFLILCGKKRTTAYHLFWSETFSHAIRGVWGWRILIWRWRSPLNKLLFWFTSYWFVLDLTPLSSRTKEKFLSKRSRTLRQTNPSTSYFLIELDSKGGDIRGICCVYFCMRCSTCAERDLAACVKYKKKSDDAKKLGRYAKRTEGKVPWINRSTKLKISSQPKRLQCHE